MYSLLVQSLVALASLGLILGEPLCAAEADQPEIETRGTIEMQKGPRIVTPLGQSLDLKQLTVVAPADPLAASPTPGWQYQMLSPLIFEERDVFHSTSTNSVGSTTDISNPAARLSSSGLTWSLGARVLAAVHLPEGARVQAFTCVFNEAPFQFQNNQGQMVTVPLRLSASLRLHKFGDPVDLMNDELFSSTVPYGVRSGVTVVQGVAFTNRMPPVENFRYDYVLVIYRDSQTAQPPMLVPPVELRGCRIGYSVQ